MASQPVAGHGVGADGLPAASPRPVLVVDDDPILCRLIEVVLRRDAGLAVRATGSLAEARAILRQGAVAAVLLDILLPDGDGLDFLGELIAAEIRPVVMLTGTDTAAVAVEAMRAGAADYVVKADGVAVLLPAVLSRAIQAEQLAATAREQRARIEALVTLNDLKSDFLARTSHELRTPLTLVLGYAELLRDRDFSREETREYASEILREARHLAGLIDSLLGMADRRDDGRAPDRAAVPLEPLLFELWALADEAERVGHVLELALEPDLRAWADPAGLRQLLQALLANALRYSPDGGPITVAAARREGGLALSVTD
ncbi:MAG TPA: response regulator, partial [Chloroflexota bacterium]